MHALTTAEKKCPEFEENQGEVYRRLEGGTCGTDLANINSIFQECYEVMSYLKVP